MRGRFKFEKLVKYPHMKPQDVAVWERFIVKNPDYFTTVDYDVCVGRERPVHTCTEENEQCECTKLYSKKIDVVGYKDEKIFVVEVKPEANMKALGQAIAYADMYYRTFEPAHDVLPMVVAEKIDEDMERVFLANLVRAEIA